MKLSIRRSWFPSKWWDNEETCEEKESALVTFHSFINSYYVNVSHRDFKDNILRFPINTPLNFSINDIREELCRYTSFLNYAPLSNNRYKTRRMIVFHNNNLLVALMEDIILRKHYKSYHIFCGDNESYNAFKDIEKKYKIRLNEVESNFSSALRILRNEYEDYYNDPDNYNDDVIIFFSKNNSLEEICCALDWYKDCYLSLPYNSFLILMLRHFFRYLCNIEIVSNSNGYCILKVSRNKYRYSTTNMIIEKVKKYWHGILKKKLFPMYYM